MLNPNCTLEIQNEDVSNGSNDELDDEDNNEQDDEDHDGFLNQSASLSLILKQLVENGKATGTL